MKKANLLLLFSLIITLPFYSHANNNNTEINWMSFEEAFELAEENPKKIFVDVYTDWCGFCKRMDNETFSDPIIAEIINEHYYPVKFNAEHVEPIYYRGTKYINENPGQRRAAHNFAIAILQGQMSYPSFAFFDEELNLITAIPGFRPPKAFEPILFFFAKDVYKENPNLDEYIQNFESSFD